MASSLVSYLPILIFLVFASVISFAIMLLPFFLGKSIPYVSKLSAYECGFAPFIGNSKKVDIRFYIISILFLIFDLEIAFLLPWAISGGMGFNGIIAVTPFFVLLLVGFIYEWKRNAMDL